VVAPSGNDGVIKSTPDNPYIVTVGSIMSNLTVPSWSNQGSNLDVVAPYCNWKVPIPGNSYVMYECGTSMSAAFVSGITGLMFSAKPNLSPAEVTQSIQHSADDFGSPGWDSMYGWGRVNAAHALTYQPSIVDVTPPAVS